MCTATSQAATWRALASASEYTATVRMPRRRAVAATRQAISPRLAISKVSNMEFIQAGLFWGCARAAAPPYIRNTPKRVSSIGALSAADSARPSTRRVSAGAMMPSSHRRAVA